ncbi:MAG: ABC transporter ATP-binding protein [Verrucomicrobia bacterium]|nr:ABC transporter ATP-binding protein [Verrucomicrobiota bacterium]
MNDPILKAEKITKTFTSPAPLELLKGIDLELYKGTSTAIIGKSGEGKSSLLHILGTLDEPTTGTLWINGKEVYYPKANLLRNRHLGFVFQAFHLLSDITAIDNLLIPRAIARYDVGPKSESFHKAVELLQKVGLYERRHLPAIKLSGGEKQRLAIARAFMCDPDILFADEPTGNLDHITAIEIQNLLFSWVEEEKKTLLVVTHSQDLARSCNASYLLESGLLLP